MCAENDENEQEPDQNAEENTAGNCHHKWIDEPASTDPTDYNTITVCEIADEVAEERGREVPEPIRMHSSRPFRRSEGQAMGKGCQFKTREQSCPLFEEGEEQHFDE